MIHLFRIYQWLIASPILLLLTLLTAIVTILGCSVSDGRIWGYYPAHYWAKAVCVLWCVRVKIIGMDNIDSKTSYVFVANHQSAFDIFSIYGYLNHNFKWMMKASLGKIIFVGKACKSAGHIMVDNTSPSKLKETMEKAESTLKDGMSLVVFPEGARTWNGKVRTFKRGAFTLANEFKLPIVPITIDGAFKVMPRTTYNVTPGTIIITIHKPITYPEGGFNLDNTISEAHDVISSVL